jgi:hypothetical protein
MRQYSSVKHLFVLSVFSAPLWYPAGTPLENSKISRFAYTLKKFTLAKDFNLNPSVLDYEIYNYR